MNTPGCKHGLVLLFGLCNPCILQISSCRYCLSPICKCLPRSWIILIMLTWCISTSSKKITLLLSCIIITQPPLSAPLLSKTASVQFSRSVMSYSLRSHEPQHAGLSVYHQLPEFTQTHVHYVGDAVQPSHPLSSPFPPAPNPSQHQSLFQWVISSYQMAKVLEFQVQHQSFQWIFSIDFL